MRVRVTALIAVTSLAFLACVGCGSRSGSGSVTSTVPVKGKVTYQGKPLTQGTITFEPDDIGREAHGNISADGSFTLTTYKEGDGAVPGLHRVAVSMTGKGKEVVAKKFLNTSSSKVKVEVTEGKTDYAVELK
jgi:hypothetical protein